MRVLLINRNDFVDGGADRVFINSVEILQTVASGLQVSTFTRKDAGLDKAPDPRTLTAWKKLKLAKRYLYNKQVARSLDDKIRDFKPDVAHVHLIFGTLSGSVLRVLKKHRIPVVMTLHDYRLVCPANAMLDRNGIICERCRGTKYCNALVHRCSEGNLFYSGIIMLEAFLRKWYLKPVKNIDRFIFVSDFARDKHIEFDCRYSRKSIRLYNMTEDKAVMPITRGDYLLYFGRLSKEKGIKTLIAAVNRLGIKLIIAGTGPQSDELLTSYNNHNNHNNFNNHNHHNLSFPGFLSTPELETLIRGCSFVVVPSEWYENNPMSVVESFALGKPVIGARIGGIPELVTADTGFLFESGNTDSLVEAIRKVLALDDTEYETLSLNCRAMAKSEFNPEKHAAILVEQYKMVI